MIKGQASPENLLRAAPQDKTPTVKKTLSSYLWPCTVSKYPVFPTYPISFNELFLNSIEIIDKKLITYSSYFH